MMKELSRGFILDAFKKIEDDPSLRNGRNSTNYDLIHEGNAFPPILILSVANQIAGGTELTLADFGNSTEKAFTILRDLKFNVFPKDKYLEEQEHFFKSKLSELGYEKAFSYLAILTELIKKLDLNFGDPRVVFSVRHDQTRLAFTIGQRYCLILQKTSDPDWGFISSEQINSESVQSKTFDGSPRAYWNKAGSISAVQQNLETVLTSISSEINRTVKSSYLKFNNRSFEKAVFNSEYRNKIFNDVFMDVNESRVEVFTDTLAEFIEQSKTPDLTYAHFQKEYNDLKVRVSFGKGNAARIPWISFLHESQLTNNGIYPVYLLYKDLNLLILAYGVSEENQPSFSWPLDNPIDISTYFKENNLGSPQRYGKSFVYKVYDLTNPIETHSIDKDLYLLTSFYKLVMGNSKEEDVKGLNIDEILAAFSSSKLIIDAQLVYRFTLSSLCKPFTILTGLSGSGKTKIAQAFSKWICASESQYKLIPVGADWTNREPLLGYPNALTPKSYVLPESGALQLILEARDNPDLPFFLILDEMNLSHVERYFADFLSAMESKEDILLHSGDEDWDGVPSKLKIPKNLFIIGTVNIDETTYMFSPKVLDRANVIEFRVSESEMDDYLKTTGDVDLDLLDGKGADMAKSFVEIATNPTKEFANQEKLNKELLKFFNELKTVGAEFGYRSAAEIRRFAGISAQLAPEWGFDDIMDAAISQKLLPKLHGSRRKLEKVLYPLGDLCYPNLEKGCSELFINHDNITPELIMKAKYPISFEKITRMHKGLVDNGFTSFAEA